MTINLKGALSLLIRVMTLVNSTRLIALPPYPPERTESFLPGCRTPVHKDQEQVRRP